MKHKAQPQKAVLLKHSTISSSQICCTKN